ncbi:MAG: uroporphyrinogen decarboxylase family protein [Candidatus Pelethousia sp.]|nr:uroporphyrinogen decarboxylase family protein [Candidatus Pelethousia sp.]
MDMLEWKLGVINNPIKKGIPVLSFPVTKLMNINVRQLISDSDNLAQGMKILADRLPMLASLSMMDLTVEAECFGASVEVYDDAIPSVSNVVVKSLEDANNLRTPKVGEGRTKTYIAAISKASKLIVDRPVFAGIIGPYTLAGRLIGMSELMTQSVTNPKMVHVVLEKATEFIIEYAKAYKAAGADGFVMAEPTTGLISPKLAKKLSHPYTKKVIDAVQDREYIVVYHNCGESVIKMAADIGDLGAQGYHFGNCIEMADILPLMPTDMLVMGNVAPADQFCVGTPETIAQKTREILEACDKYPNFVISSGCDMPPVSKWECIDAFFDTITKFYQAKR